MDPRQRITAALTHREPDRTPVFEYVLQSPVADALLGRPYAADPTHWDRLVKELGWETAVRQSAHDQVALARLLGHDLIYAVPIPGPVPDHSLPDQGPDTADPVARVKQRNEKSTPMPGPDDRSFFIYECIKNELKQRNLDIPLLAPAYAHGVWTDIDLMQTMVLDPAVAHCHFELATQRALNLVKKYLSLGVELIGVGGDFAGNRPLISPEMYRAFIMPQIRVLAEYIHSRNAYAVNTSDGNLWPVIDDFLTGCRVDGYLEIDYHAGMDLKKLKAGYGDRITFFGNLDCGNVLSFGTPAQVRSHVTECLAAGAGHGGHVLCAGNAITASVPVENYLAVINAYREVFGLPRFNLIPEQCATV